jgi:1-acyl-sn-glycerol-3-phosphate acyltransferase
MVEPAWWWALPPAAVVLVWFVRRCRAANHTDWGAAWINYLDGFNRIFCRRFHRLRHEPLPLPATGAALLVSNHVSGLDPLLLFAASRRPLRFVIAREEYERWGFTWLFRAVGCIPIERSRNPRAALLAARQALAAGEVVALFPHGRIHLDHEPRQALKRGVAWLAEATRAPVFPVRIDGVRGQGLTLAAVFLPGRTRLQSFQPLYLQDHGPAAFLEHLQRILTNSAE